MIKVFVDLEKIKQIIKLFLDLKRIKFDDKDFHTNFNIDINVEFIELFEQLNVKLNCLNEAIVREDRVAVNAFMIYSRGSMMQISSLFYALHEDLDSLSESHFDLESTRMPISQKYQNKFEKEGINLDIDLNLFKSIMHKLILFEETKIFDKTYPLEYQGDSNQFLVENINELGKNLEFFYCDFIHNRMTNSKFFLQKSCEALQRLFVFFDFLRDEIEGVLWADSISFPDIPDSYQIPDSYNYPKKML